jgi:hypothetical protein
MPALTDNTWRLILNRIRAERCVPFLGAGASLGTPDSPGLPTASTLAERLADECEFPSPSRSDFLRVAQYYEMAMDAHEVRRSIREKLLIRGVRPSPVHLALAALPFRYVLTTNYDKLMEDAFEEVGKTPRVYVYERYQDKQDVPAGTVEEPVVYKLHGSLDKLDSMVVSENDVVDFLACLLLEDPPLPATIRGLFEENSILFIGYGLKDWNVRVMLRAIRRRRAAAPPDKKSFAIQRRPEDPPSALEWDRCVLFWEQRESLQCFDANAVEFGVELKRRYDAGRTPP